MIWRFEKSNEGFHWDGDETKLKGLLIGISVQEDSYNGSFFTRPSRFEIVDDVRQGKVNVMPPRQRKDGNSTDPTMAPMAAPAPIVDQRSGYQQVSTSELPF